MYCMSSNKFFLHRNYMTNNEWGSRNRFLLHSSMPFALMIAGANSWSVCHFDGGKVKWKIKQQQAKEKGIVLSRLVKVNLHNNAVQMEPSISLTSLAASSAKASLHHLSLHKIYMRPCHRCQLNWSNFNFGAMCLAVTCKCVYKSSTLKGWMHIWVNHPLDH